MITPHFEGYRCLQDTTSDEERPWFWMLYSLTEPPIHMQATAIADQK